MIASAIDLPDGGTLVITLADRDKPEALPLVREFERQGFRIYATSGTADFLERSGIQTERVFKISEGSPNTLDLIRQNQVHLIVNTLSPSSKTEEEGRQMRRAAVERGIPCLTSLDTARALLYALEQDSETGMRQVMSMAEYLAATPVEVE
jgi:carbamoyl-phosphate synthase large subunit